MTKKRKKSTDEKQTLILWALLVRTDASAFQNELKPKPTKADRDALVRSGLIKSEERGRYRRIWLEVTAKGMKWAGDNLDAALPSNSPAGCEILQAWLTRLKTFLGSRSLDLSDLLASTSVKARRIGENENLRSRIRKAYLDITGSRLKSRALLSDLRERLQDVERGELDDALKEMQRDEVASLYQLDNRIEITDADRAAAIYFGTEPRHILWIER